jgi:uncharacterized repeat protein (TIGR03803 family)
MKTCVTSLFLLPALIVGLGVMMLAGQVTAQTFTTLHNFTEIDPIILVNSDGAHPTAELILSGNTLYGTAGQGGSSACGTVFSVNTNGTGFTTLYTFTGNDGCVPWTHPSHSGMELRQRGWFSSAFEVSVGLRR